MQTLRRRITFAGWQLGEYGGLETRIAAAMNLAEDAGWETSVRLVRPVALGSPTALLLEGKDVRSVIGDWERRPWVRAGRFAGGLAAAARHRRRLTAIERRSIGHRRSRTQIDRYWDGAGRHLLTCTDVLHLFGPPMPFVVGAMRAATELGVPTVYQSVHAVTADYATHKWRKGFIDSCNMLDLILLSHASQADDFTQHFGYLGGVEVLGQWAYGIESPLLEIRRAGTPESAPVTIGALSRLDRVKGVDVLLRAFAELPERLNAVLIVGGTGDEDAELRGLADSLGISGRVNFVGYVDDRVAFYNQIDVFVIASRFEGGPVTGVEAMAAGLPIVSTRSGAMPERLEGGRGLLTDVDDVEQMRSALLTLADDVGLRRELGAAARERYLHDYSAAALAKRLLSTWDRLSDERRGRPPGARKVRQP